MRLAIGKDGLVVKAGGLGEADDLDVRICFVPTWLEHPRASPSMAVRPVLALDDPRDGYVRHWFAIIEQRLAFRN